MSVRVGGALLYMHDAQTVASFNRVWQSVAHQARILPREADPRRAMPVRGMAEPAVMVEAADSPPASARMERPVGRASHLRVVLGRVVFDVRDLGAFHSTVTAFHRAEELAATAFLPTPGPSAREQAAAAAARVFASPARASTRPAAAAREAVAGAAASRRSRSAIERVV
ncbi:hypothetical protein [Pseudonocardia kunmingensis]|uniref:hypothetical protein n=1 Tax=Pseudonocardia kunmingensis TaxID=630975 RepID=UPI001151395B|nr:hypothetical protein [Pseudonocardia kunmingensis]